MIVVLVTNDGYQSIRDLQQRNTGVGFATELRRREPGKHLTGDVIPIEYVSNAHSLGCRALRATTVDELDDALLTARDLRGPKVIECPVEPYTMLPGGGAWWDVGIAESSQRIEMRDLAEAHVKERGEQRFYYSGAVESSG